jgi:hypothetical protein
MEKKGAKGQRGKGTEAESKKITFCLNGPGYFNLPGKKVRRKWNCFQQNTYRVVSL